MISKYILKLEKDGEIFSTNTLYLPVEIDEFLSTKKVILVHSDSITDENGKRIYNKKLYKTTQGFYIYLVRGSESMFKLTLYYKQEQSNEFDLFISQLLKQFKQIKQL